MNVDYSDLEDVVCEQCESKHFEQVYLIKKVPALLSPTHRATFAPAQVFRCTECKHINEVLMPK